MWEQRSSLSETCVHVSWENAFMWMRECVRMCESVRSCVRECVHASKVRLRVIHIYPTPPLGQDLTKGQFLSGGLNSEFSFSYTSCLAKAEEPCLPYYLPIAGGRIIGYIPFPRVLVLCEMQSSPGFELVSPCPFPTTITITPLAPPKSYSACVRACMLETSIRVRERMHSCV